MFSESKSIPKKKERTLDFNRYKTPPGAYAKNALSSTCRRWLLLRWRREKICNNTTTKKRTQKRRETRPRKSKLSVLEPPLSVLSQLFSFIHLLPAGGEIQKRSICIYKTERKQTMKKRAPTLPPTIIDRPIIDRGLSMIAMRVTFSRACARARKKKSDIICARKCAQMRARESEEEMKKKCVFLIQIQKFLFPFPQFSLFFLFLRRRK